MKCIVCIIRVHLFVLGIIDPSDTKDDAKPFSVPDFKKIPSWLVCGYRSMCLQTARCLAFKSPLGWDCFLHSSHLVHTEDSEDSHSLLYRSWPS